MRAPNRTTADLSSYPGLVVIYLGMRVNSPKGVATLVSFGSKIRESVQAQPDGLLLHENLLFSLVPPHAGMRQHWRDFDSLERCFRLAAAWACGKEANFPRASAKKSSTGGEAADRRG